MILGIMNISELFYHGWYAGNRTEEELIVNVLQRLGNYSKKVDTLAICFDDAHTKKNEAFKALFPTLEYKYSREQSRDQEQHEVIVQAGIDLYSILSNAGLNVFRAKGYEADDCIYSLVRKYEEDPDVDKIYLYNSDSDLFFLVSDKVINIAMQKKVKYPVISMSNYAQAVSSKFDNNIYNTIHFTKLMAGDTSDSIPGIGFNWTHVLYKGLTDDEKANLGNLDFARKVIKRAMEDEESTYLMYRNIAVDIFNLLVPYDITKVIPLDIYDEDKTVYGKIVQALCQGEDIEDLLGKGVR